MVANESITKDEILFALQSGGSVLNTTRQKFRHSLNSKRAQTLFESKQVIDKICRDLDDFLDSHS